MPRLGLIMSPSFSNAAPSRRPKLDSIDPAQLVLVGASVMMRQGEHRSLDHLFKVAQNRPFFFRDLNMSLRCCGAPL